MFLTHKIFFIIFLFFFSFLDPIFSQDCIIIENDDDMFDISNKLMFLEDPQKSMDIDDIMRAKNERKFNSGSGNIPSFGFTSSAYWAYFYVKNELKYEMPCLLELLNFDKITIFLPDGKGNYIEKKAGKLIDKPSGKLKYGYLVFTLPLLASEEKTFFIRFESQDPMILFARLWTLDAYSLSSHLKQYFYGIYFGIMIAMILYNIFIYLTLRDISYLYYVLYILSVSLTHLLLINLIKEFFPFINSWLLDNAETILSGLAFVFGIQFCRYFLSVRKHSKLLDIILRTGIYISIFLIVSVFFLSFGIRSILTSILTIMFPIIMTIITITILRKGYRPAIFYLLAWSVFALGMIVFTLRNFGIIPDSFFTSSSITFGSALEAVLLAFGLAYRINLLQREKERAQAESLKSLKKANKLEHDYRQLFELNPLGIAVLDINGQYLAVNPAYCKIYERSQAEFIDKNYLDIIVPPQKWAQEKMRFSRIIQSVPEELKSFEQVNLKKSGEEIIVKYDIDSTFNDDNSINGLIICAEDITKVKQQSDQLKSSLKEKEILLKEIHHRVKNNLQIIISLINMQFRFLKDDEIMDLFQSVRNKIFSIALAHNKLYQSKDLTKISIKGYIQSLTNNIFSTFGISLNKIRVDLNAGNIFLEINKIIPCGLIINELMTNSLKYAFPKKGKGTINLKFSKKTQAGKKKYILIFKDNGIGFPKGFNFCKTETLGMQLIIALVEQLEGTIKELRNKGVGFKIIFSD